MIKTNMPYTIRVMLLNAQTLIPWVQQYGQTPAVSESAKDEDKSMVLIGGGKFIMGKGAMPADPAKQYKDNPAHEIITGVSYSDAQEFAVWAGKRLPTEAVDRRNKPRFF